MLVSRSFLALTVAPSVYEHISRRMSLRLLSA